jgi:hypothetical protein
MLAKADLRAYQERTATWLYERDTGIAVLDLGSGKTAATLTAIAELIRDGVIRHALIIAPKRVAELVWPAEIANWAHLAHLRYAVLNGNPAERKALIGSAFTRDLTIIGIDLVQWLVTELAKLTDPYPLFDLLVIDETSKIKSPTSKRARALYNQAHRFKNRWGLTGTPRPNGAHDLFQQAKVITDGQLWGRSFSRWQRERFEPVGYNWMIKSEWVGRTAEEFASIAITLDEGDMPDLPELNTVLDPVRLPDAVWERYTKLQEDLLLDVEGDPVEVASAAVATGKLAQLVSGFLYGPDGSTGAIEHLHEAKLDWLDETIEALDGQSLLVVYEFIEDARRLRRRYSGIPVIGQGTSSKEAADAVTRWNAGELPLLAIHPASAGHGLNLQFGGSHMAWLGLTWSPELYGQTIKRIHRPGQKRHCTIHIPMVFG